jgi:hypothetical protein
MVCLSIKLKTYPILTLFLKLLVCQLEVYPKLTRRLEIGDFRLEIAKISRNGTIWRHRNNKCLIPLSTPLPKSILEEE